MRALVAVIALGLLASSAVTADARPRKPQAAQAKRIQQPRGKSAAKRAVAVREDRRGQSIGLPWAGQLEHPTRLRFGDGVVIRRPHRAFGTRTTVEWVRRVVNDTLELFPRAHVYAIGDLSAEAGGQITEHHSHQSGRDADLGLFYKKKPAGYPTSFIRATEDNLDCSATFTLLSKLVATADRDGGVQVIFLDYDLQGVLYRWALDHGVNERRLERMFQYPHGRGAAAGLIRHEPYHDNHIHARFRCSSTDADCR